MIILSRKLDLKSPQIWYSVSIVFQRIITRLVLSFPTIFRE